jgi:hypothetical protein
MKIFDMDKYLYQRQTATIKVGFFNTNCHEQIDEFYANFMSKLFTLRASHLDRIRCVAGRSR